MKKENLYYAIFALLVIIFCAVTAMRVFAETLHVGKPEKKKDWESDRRMRGPEWCLNLRKLNTAIIK